MKNLKIGTRLGLGFAVLLMLMVLMTGGGMWRLNNVNEMVPGVTGIHFAKERHTGDWYRSIHSSVRRTTAVTKSADSSLATFFAKFSEK